MDLALVFAIALAFYTLTLAPTVTWGDSAWLSVGVFTRSLQMGTAGDHPLFLLVGRLFSALPGDLARNINFEAAVFGALTVMLIYRFARRLGCSTWAAAIGAAALCVSHAFWLHSVIAEVYTANAFFLAATLTLLLQWRDSRRVAWLAAATVVFAVGLANHLVLATAAPAAIIFVAATSWRTLLTRRSIAILAVLASLVLVIALAPPPPILAAFRKVWFGPPGIAEYLQLRIEPRRAMEETAFYALLFTYQFPSIALLLGLAGIWALLRDKPAVAALLLLTTAVNAGVFIRQTGFPSVGTTKFVFYIADYVVFSIFCAVGADVLLRRIAARVPPARLRYWALTLIAVVALVPPLIYAIAPSAALAVSHRGIDLVRPRRVQYRDDARFFLNPNKRGEDGARRFATEALEIAAPGAVIFADSTPGAVLEYLRVVELRRPDVSVRFAPVDGQEVPVRWAFAGGQRRRTYLSSLNLSYYDLTHLTGTYDLVPAGPMIEIRPRELP